MRSASLRILLGLLLLVGDLTGGGVAGQTVETLPLADSLGLAEAIGRAIATFDSTEVPTSVPVVLRLTDERTPAYLRTRPDIPAEIADSILPLLAAAVADSNLPTDEPITIVASLRGQIQIFAKRSSITPPRLLNREDISRVIERFGERSATPGTMRLWLRLEPDGKVINFEIEARSGYVNFEDMAREIARRARYEPANADGVPIPIWVSMPVNVMFR